MLSISTLHPASPRHSSVRRRGILSARPPPAAPFVPERLSHLSLSFLQPAGAGPRRRPRAKEESHPTGKTGPFDNFFCRRSTSPRATRGHLHDLDRCINPFSSGPAEALRVRGMSRLALSQGASPRVHFSFLSYSCRWPPGVRQSSVVDRDAEHWPSLLPLQIHADSDSPCNPRHLSRSGLTDRRSVDCLPWDTLTRCSHPSVRNCVILRRSFFLTTRSRGSKGSRPSLKDSFHSFHSLCSPRLARNPVRAGLRLHRRDRPNHGPQFCSCPSAPLNGVALGERAAFAVVLENDRTQECVVLTLNGFRTPSVDAVQYRPATRANQFSFLFLHQNPWIFRHSHSFRYF